MEPDPPWERHPAAKARPRTLGQGCPYHGIQSPLFSSLSPTLQLPPDNRHHRRSKFLIAMDR